MSRRGVLELEEFSNLLTRAVEWSIFNSPMMCDKEIWTLSEAEKKRRERVLQDAVASCAIEGLELPPEALEEVRKVSQMYETSDEMIAHLIKSMEASNE